MHTAHAPLCRINGGHIPVDAKGKARKTRLIDAHAPSTRCPVPAGADPAPFLRHRHGWWCPGGGGRPGGACVACLVGQPCMQRSKCLTECLPLP
jgi:hypothetical protein